MEMYAKRAKDGELVGYATEIKDFAVRRLGEEMAAGPKAKGGAEKGVGRRGNNAGISKTRIVPLEKQGIDKNLADRARKAAAMDALPLTDGHISVP